MKTPPASRSARDKATNSMPKVGSVRRRLTSRLQPLHGGLGFGAGEIKERALVVARQASERGSAQPASMRGQPALGSSGQGLQFSEEKTVVRRSEPMPYLLDDAEADGRVQELNKQVRRAATGVPSGFNRPDSRRVGGEGSAIPSIKSFIAAQRRESVPSALQGLTAWIFDTLIVFACLLVGFTLSASVPFISLLSQKFPAIARFSSYDPAGALGWLLIAAQTIALAALLLFTVQAFAGFFLAATVGRAIADVRLVRSRSAMGRAFKIALGEVLHMPLGFGLLNLIVSREHNFLVRSLRWCRGSSAQ